MRFSDDLDHCLDPLIFKGFLINTRNLYIGCIGHWHMYVVSEYSY